LLKRTKANLKRYKASVLKAAVEGKLTEEWRKQHPNIEPASKLLERNLAERRAKWNAKGKYEEPNAPNTVELPSLPNRWTWATVDQVAEVLLGKMLDKDKHRSGRLLRYLRNINVRWGRVKIEDLLEMFFDEDELDRYGLRGGDVLVCEGGEPGRAAVWDGRISGLKYQKALHRVRFYSDFEAKYLVFLLEFLANTGRLYRWFTGSTIKHFTRESFVSLPIPMPPLLEQRRIVSEVERRLSVIEELQATVDNNLTRSACFRQSILAKAFKGTLIQ
jgi:type I restriction enzyme S subunit